MDMYFPNYCKQCGKRINLERTPVSAGDIKIMTAVYTLCKECSQKGDCKDKNDTPICR